MSRYTTNRHAYWTAMGKQNRAKKAAGVAEAERVSGDPRSALGASESKPSSPGYGAGPPPASEPTPENDGPRCVNTEARPETQPVRRLQVATVNEEFDDYVLYAAKDAVRDAQTPHQRQIAERLVSVLERKRAEAVARKAS